MHAENQARERGAKVAHPCETDLACIRCAEARREGGQREAFAGRLDGTALAFSSLKLASIRMAWTNCVGYNCLEYNCCWIQRPWLSAMGPSSNRISALNGS